jgi:hypothetical protein
MAIFPRQRTNKKDQTFCVDTAKYWKELSDYSSSYYSELGVLYRAAEGSLNTEDYGHILNPLGTEDERFKQFPSKLRNLNIIKPVVSAMQGERLLKPNEFRVLCVNDNETNSMIDTVNKEIEGYWAQDLVNKMADAGVADQAMKKELPNFDEFRAERLASYRQKRAIFGQEALDYIRHDLQVDDKYQDALYNWTVCGNVVSFKDIHHNDLDLMICNPNDIWYSLPTGSNFIEDGNAVVYRRKMNFNEVLDRFYDVISDKDLDKLEEYSTMLNNPENYQNIFLKNQQFESGVTQKQFTNLVNSHGVMNVYHIVWKTNVKFGVLDYIDDFGMLQQTEVSHDYDFEEGAGDINLSWYWGNQVYSIYQLGDDNDAVFTKGAPLLVQRNELNNSSTCKLPYNGRILMNQDGTPQSLVKDGLQYQAVVNIVNYQREMVINKNKDKVLLMPLGLVPKDLGKDPVEAFTYYLASSSIAWYDDKMPNAAAMIQGIKSVDLGLGNYIEQMNNIILSARNEYWDAVGMNRQRYGQQMASDGKYTTEQALIRSTLITAEYFRKFDKFVETDMNGLLDYSKGAWIDGKKGMYLNSSGREQFFSVDAQEAVHHLESEYGVFVVDNAAESSKVEGLKGIAHALAQDSNMPKSAAAMALTDNNSARIINYIKQAEKITQAIQQQQETERNETQKYVADKTLEAATINKEVTIEKAYIDKEKAIEVALINAQANVLGYDQGEGGEGDAALIDQYQNEREGNRKDRELSLKERVANDNRALKDKDLALKDKQIESQEKIAKMNKNKYDK